MSFLRFIVLLLVIVGAVNWGLWGLFNYNLVAAIFGEQTLLARLVYILVGVAGVWAISFFSCVCKSESCCSNDDHKQGE